MILSFPNKSNYRKTMAFSIRFFCSNIYVMYLAMYRVLLFFRWLMVEKDNRNLASPWTIAAA